MQHRSHRKSAALSKYIWSLKDKNTDFNVSWSARRRATAYQNTARRCNLCLAEMLEGEIIKADKGRSLNKKIELISKCRPKNRFYLCNFPAAVPWTRCVPFSGFPDFPSSVSADLFKYLNFFRLFQILLKVSNFSILLNFSNSFLTFLILPMFSEIFDFLPVFSL